LLYAAEHFVVQRFLEGLVRLQIGISVSVFHFEVLQDARISLVAEPGVVVNAAITVDDVLDRFARGDGG
jgi:hypothetical protein